MILTIHCFTLLIIHVFLANKVLGRRKEDKLVPSPVELIDMVREEQFKNKVTWSQSKNRSSLPKASNKRDEARKPHDVADLCEDENTLRSRKVWSRWSKWGDCSVTCGGGAMSRHRVCVAGRCAPGELEEQRRPCSRIPCVVVNVTDELRDME